MDENGESYTHLTREERDLLYLMRSEKKGIREIARVLGRDAGTISRELRRNRHFFPGVERKMSALERAAHAHEKALGRRKIPRKQSKLSCEPEIKEHVIWLIEDEHASPRDITFRVAEKFPGKTIAYTTIYNFTRYERCDLRVYHRLRGKPRRQHVTKRRARVKEGAPPKRTILLRSEIVVQRREFGHWESDTIHSMKNGSGFAILTLREMKSRMRWYFLLSSLLAELTLAVLQGFFRLLPAHLRRTLTVDNGPEFAHLYKLEQIFPGFLVYSCDPYCAWQRGTSEHANGEFRWFYPKGTDFRNVSLREIWATQDKINRRHMLCLGGRSAVSVFQRALKEPLTSELLDIGSRTPRAGAHFEQMIIPFPPSPTLLDLDSSHSESIVRGLCLG